MSCGKGFTTFSAEQMSHSLGQKLIKTVDKLRDLQTKFGLRPYVVKIVRTRWTGGARGEGEQIIVREEAVLPTPRVRDVADMRDVLEMVGRQEAGDVVVSEISGRYSEGFLQGYDADGTPVGEDEQIHWLIEFPAQDRGGTVKRRWFQIVSVPGFAADRFEWRVTLTSENAVLPEFET